MLFQNSLIAHLCVMNKSDTANKNFEAFINPMETTNTKYDKVIALTEDPDSIVVVFVVGNRNKVKFIHNLKKFGSTRNNATVIIGGLMGKGARAVPVTVNVDNVTSSQDIIIPPFNKIWGCKSMEELMNIPMVNSGDAIHPHRNHTHGDDQVEMPSQNHDEDEVQPPAYTKSAAKFPSPSWPSHHLK